MSIAWHKWLILLIPVTLAGVFAFHALKNDAPWLAGGIGVVLLLAILLLTTLDWPSHDEAARAAMKDSWFWGTSIGITLAVAGLVLLRTVQDAGVPMAFSSSNPVNYIAVGAIATILCQGVCASVAWVLWWVSKR